MSAVGHAPGKVILVGEHAVVYGRPAIAVPVWDTVATATIEECPAGSGCVIIAHDIDAQVELLHAETDNPLALVVRLTLEKLNLEPNPAWRIEVSSDIPIASGMGSGAAVSAAIVRAIYQRAGADASPDDVSRVVYASEEIHHGTPSGIDNTVVSYGRPVWFKLGEAPEVFETGQPFMLAIADSGVPSPTRETVAGVRNRRERDEAAYLSWFDEIGEIAHRARAAIEKGRMQQLGELFNRNQELLEQIGVSTQLLQRLIRAANRAGASGAKLSGGGGGGNVIALVTAETAKPVADGFRAAGARNVIVTTVGSD